MSIVSTAPEEAAILHGIVDTIAPDRWEYSGVRPRTNAAIDSALDPVRATALHTRGTQISANEVVAYISALVERQLDASGSTPSRALPGPW